MGEAIFSPLVLGAVGAAFGSFIATVAVRWLGGGSALKGRSACDGCSRTLRAVELLPVVSYIAVRGRCRTCGGRIAPLHPVVEVFGLAIGVIAGVVSPNLAGVAGAVFGWLLLALGAIDFVAYRLPNALTLAVAVTGLAGGLAALPPDLIDRAIGGVAGFFSLWLVAWSYRRLRGRTGLGGGDPKLFGAIGLWLGWRALPAALLIACLLGLVVAVAKRKALHDRLPLGSLLAAGGFAMWVAYHWSGRVG